MHIAARWVVPMKDVGELLEEHTLVMRDGRILDVLPSRIAAERYAPRVTLERPAHLLMPGLVNARTRSGPPTAVGRFDGEGHHPDAGEQRFDGDAALLAIANMLKSGVTAFCDIGHAPGEAARIAAHQGLRAVIGLPLDDRPGPWARDFTEYLTRAIRLRDEYKGHPSISTAFAPLRVHALDTATLARIGTLAAELDAAVLVSVHDSLQAVHECVARHAARPLARLEAAGLLTPALSASHLGHLEPSEIELAQRAGIGVVLCLASDLLRGNGLPAIDPLSGLRVALGTDAATCGSAHDLWTEIKLYALHAGGGARPEAALAAATRGGAAVLGLDAEVGTLEPGKWADVCCIELTGPATSAASDPLRQLALIGGRDLVSDVWVAGRQLVSEGQFTRLDFAALSKRLKERA
jgi:5-methylthioadenosine/S-adenosylhomocysteine deaminase